MHFSNLIVHKAHRMALALPVLKPPRHRKGSRRTRDTADGAERRAMRVAEGAFSASIKVAETLASLRLSFVRSRGICRCPTRADAQKRSFAVMLLLLLENTILQNMSKTRIFASTVSLSLVLLVSFAFLSALSMLDLLPTYYLMTVKQLCVSCLS